jgi:hypothetical protein
MRHANGVCASAQVAGGRVRLALSGGFGAPSASAPPAICLAESSDGSAFSVIAVAVMLTTEFITDFSIVPLRDGRWLMTLSTGQQTILARSSDGLTVAQGERLTLH